MDNKIQETECISTDLSGDPMHLQTGLRSKQQREPCELPSTDNLKTASRKSSSNQLARFPRSGTLCHQR
jgi:hypothetical protein